MNPHEHDVITQCRFLKDEEFEVVEVRRLAPGRTGMADQSHLQSIYPDYISRGTAKGLDVIFLEIPVHIPGVYRNVVVTAEETSTYTAAASAPASTVTYNLSDLPPILLHVILPHDYPLHAAPQILSLHATHSWLPRERILVDALLDMWQAGDGVLYSWIDHIESGSFMDTLGLSVNGSSIRYVLPATYFVHSFTYRYQDPTPRTSRHAARAQKL
jgi:hypothetical protein